MVEITQEKAKELLTKLIKADKRTPIILEGESGTGKSVLIEKFAEDNNYKFIKLELSKLEAYDLLGIPKESAKNEYFTFVPPKWLITASKSKSLIFLDELNQTPHGVLNAVQMLLSSYSCGDYKLHKDTVIIAAQNSSDKEGYINQELSVPILDRCIVLRIKPTLKEFISRNKMEERIKKTLLTMENYMFSHSENVPFISFRTIKKLALLISASDIETGVLSILGNNPTSDLVIKRLGGEEIDVEFHVKQIINKYNEDNKVELSKELYSKLDDFGIGGIYDKLKLVKDACIKTQHTKFWGDFCYLLFYKINDELIQGMPEFLETNIYKVNYLHDIFGKDAKISKKASSYYLTGIYQDKEYSIQIDSLFTNYSSCKICSRNISIRDLMDDSSKEIKKKDGTHEIQVETIFRDLYTGDDITETIRIPSDVILNSDYYMVKIDPISKTVAIELNLTYDDNKISAFKIAEYYMKDYKLTTVAGDDKNA